MIVVYHEIPKETDSSRAINGNPFGSRIPSTSLPPCIQRASRSHTRSLRFTWIAQGRNKVVNSSSSYPAANRCRRKRWLKRHTKVPPLRPPASNISCHQYLLCHSSELSLPCSCMLVFRRAHDWLFEFQQTTICHANPPKHSS